MISMSIGIVAQEIHHYKRYNKRISNLLPTAYISVSYSVQQKMMCINLWKMPYDFFVAHNFTRLSIWIVVHNGHEHQP